MRTIVCQTCHVTVPQRASAQRYCEEYSTNRDLERKRLWARAHPPSPKQRVVRIERLRRSQELARSAGEMVNEDARHSITWDGQAGPDLLWQVAIAVPFSYAASKNHLFAMRRQGHVALRRESRTIRSDITLRLREALVGRRIAHNKLWIDILVQKPNHRGDAINVIDLVCDAVKDAVRVDDRWFCIRRVDWEIVRREPQLYLKVGQESDHDCQVCSFCGQIQDLSAFTRRRGTPLGVDRVCRNCRKTGRRLAKAGRVTDE